MSSRTLFRAFALAAGLAVPMTPAILRADAPAAPDEVRPWAYTAPARRPVPSPAASAADAAKRQERERLVTQWREAAERAVREGAWNEADAAIQRALSIAPGRPDLDSRAAQIFTRTGSYGLALESWQRLLEEFPRAAGLRSGLAATYFLMGRMEEAQQEAEHALALDPREARARFYRAALLVRQGQTNDAAAALGTLTLLDLTQAVQEMIEQQAPLVKHLKPAGFQQLLALVLQQPAADPARLPAIRTALGQALGALARGQWEPASRSLLQVQQEGVRAPALLYDLAYCRYRQAPGTDSLARLERVVNGLPDARAFAPSYLWLCLAEENYAAAERALPLLPEGDVPDHLLIRAALRAGQGRTDEARAALAAIPVTQREELVSRYAAEVPALRRWQQQDPLRGGTGRLP